MSRGRSPRREAASVVQPSTVTPGTPPPSLFPLWDALDNEAKTSCSPYDEKFLKSDYSLPHTFRESTGGTRSLDPNKMDPPPSRFAATTDRKKNFGLVSEWWKMGAKQQKAELFRYVNFPYQNKMRFMHNVDRLIIEQLSLFYTLTKQRTKFDEALTIALCEGSRSWRSVSVLPPICKPPNRRGRNDEEMIFDKYFVFPEEGGKMHDAAYLLASLDCSLYDDDLIDLGSADLFMEGQWTPYATIAAAEDCSEKDPHLFVGKFIKDHVEFHAKRLTNGEKSACI
jgi:hypothetical protein